MFNDSSTQNRFSGLQGSFWNGPLNRRLADVLEGARFKDWGKTQKKMGLSVEHRCSQRRLERSGKASIFDLFQLTATATELEIDGSLL